MQGKVVARKELSRASPGTNEESELLFLLGSMRHNNIIELLASYSQNGITNLLFPLAEMDLDNFLLQPSRPEDFKQNIRFFKALQGLSSGLAYLHNFKPRPRGVHGATTVLMHGYHHDIKPRNVLVRGGNFVLADFGSSRLKRADESTKTMWKETTMEYGAPECRNPESFAPGKVGRALDVWSIGCIISEVITYMEAGLQAVQQFREVRVLEGVYGKTRYFHDGERMSDEVGTFLQASEEQASSTATREIFTLVREMLSRSPSMRPEAEEVEQQLMHLSIKEHLDALIRLIAGCFKHAASSSHKALYHARLNLEQDRLLSWATELGFRPMFGRLKEYNAHTRTFFSDFSTALEHAINELNSKHQFNAVQDSHDFTLNTLIQMNDSLCINLSEDTKASIDDIFFLIASSGLEQDSLRRIEMVGDMETLTRHPQLYHDVGAIASMKLMAILVSRENSTILHDTTIQPALIREDSNKGNLDARPQVYWYSFGFVEGQEKKVLLEWKGYAAQRTHPVGTPEFEEAGKALFERVKDLVTLLKHDPKPTNFPVLKCLGTFHDPGKQRFGVVYDFPPNSATSIRLHRLLRRGRAQEVYPDLGQKFRLAKILVSSLHTFHTSGWLHKNISSSNVIFFLNSSTKLFEPDLTQPYIIGFHHSRKDDPGAYTEGPELLDAQKEYQHPNYRQGSGRFRKGYDYYSLGLVLLEIGTWSSLSHIYGRWTTHSPKQLNEEYLKWCDNDLKKAMGPIYHSVTKRCLLFGNEIGGGDDIGVQLDFQSEVIAKLNQCVV